MPKTLKPTITNEDITEEVKADNKQASSGTITHLDKETEQAEKVIKKVRNKEIKPATAVDMVKTDLSDETIYVVMCSEMTILNGNGENVKLKKDDEITKKEYPVAWVEAALTNKWVINKEDRNRNVDELRAMGYNVHPGAKKSQ